MDARDFQKWIDSYYKERGWADLDIFVRIGFLSEETGEVARAIRALEIGRDRPDEVEGTFDECKKNLTEELGDVLGNVAVIANKYNIDFEDIFSQHRNKLFDRYQK
ncbi:MazG nucleotide pyrophosphohydrolase domain-containing protein [Bacillus sp. SD088]|uniref:MazG nucleotide pyrophosphohydrolase domain-containing protein n=1 Tax=Bacillus sp. SD088 TaxID=2782012 RepID=UPI001A97190D|nr:MazG-like family protein [Bacillus sp. SD088]MBO0995835.1 MazG-like family protein [Bacillus sp. SD088]